ncbi:Crp/Fnr family transcriptional regulator [Labilibacter sediminis]|nr:Crp/Fnr family transcriptional regulator [Labilibacter sediminis]
MDNRHCVSCDKKCDCFKLLTEDELRLINSNRSLITYKKGETIIKQGALFREVISFNGGIAKIHIKGEHNKELLLGVITPSEIIGGPGLFFENRYSYSITALSDCTTCLIDSNIFKQIFRSNGEFAESFLNSFSKRYVHTFDRVISLTQKQMHGRLADALLFLSDKVHFSDTFDLVFSRQELADFTAMSKESVCRILKEFKDDRIIETSGRQINIIDKDFLSKINNAG